MYCTWKGNFLEIILWRILASYCFESEHFTHIIYYNRLQYRPIPKEIFPKLTNSVKNAMFGGLNTPLIQLCNLNGQMLVWKDNQPPSTSLSLNNSRPIFSRLNLNFVIPDSYNSQPKWTLLANDLVGNVIKKAFVSSECLYPNCLSLPTLCTIN